MRSVDFSLLDYAIGIKNLLKLLPPSSSKSLSESSELMLIFLPPPTAPASPAEEIGGLETPPLLGVTSEGPRSTAQLLFQAPLKVVGKFRTG